jgi:DNA-binding NarL/FixJ family response regulator
MGGQQTRILVVDNDARVRLALRTLLNQERSQIVVQESSDLGGLAIQMKEFQPDLILLDWELPGRPAAALLFALHGLDYHPKVIVLSRRPESEEAALAAGADAFISKGDSPDRFLHVLQGVVEGSRAAPGSPDA